MAARKMFLNTPLSIIWEEMESSLDFKGSVYLSNVFQLLRCEITLSDFYESTKDVSADLNDRFLNGISTQLKSTILGKLTTPKLKQRIPGPRRIRTYLMLYSCKYGIEEFEPECAIIIFQFVKNQICAILEAVLRLARPFKVTDSGLTHSFGVIKAGQPLNSVTKFIMLAEDVINALEFENELIPHRLLSMSLIKRLWNIQHKEHQK